MGQRLGLFHVKMHKTSSFYIALLTNAIFGIVTSHTIVNQGDPNMFEQTTRLEKVKLSSQSTPKFMDKTLNNHETEKPQYIYYLN